MNGQWYNSISDILAYSLYSFFLSLLCMKIISGLISPIHLCICRSCRNVRPKRNAQAANLTHVQKPFTSPHPLLLSPTLLIRQMRTFATRPPQIE